MTTDAAPAPRRATKRRSPTNRSRVGNGKLLVAGLDQRSADAREYHDIVADLVTHLGGEPSTVQLAIVEEASGLIWWCRRQRLALLKGEGFEVGPYTTATNSLRRLLVDIGLDRRARDITPTLQGYVARRAAERASESPTPANPQNRAGESLSPPEGQAA